MRIDFIIKYVYLEYLPKRVSCNFEIINTQGIRYCEYAIYGSSQTLFCRMGYGNLNKSTKNGCLRNGIRGYIVVVLCVCL